jgi:hypothetical protein
MQSWTLSSPFRLCGMLLALAAAPAMAGVAGTGTAQVTVNFITQKLGVTATFANKAVDIPNVNLGTLAPFSATDVKVTDVDVLTGGSFVVPFTNAPNGTDSFTADGDVACPATGCTTLPGVFGFVGQLDPGSLHVSLPLPDKIYTFDGSATCTGNAVIGANCSGPFALNFFSPADVQPGSPVIQNDTYFDPSLGIVRHLDTRVTLSNVTTPGTLDVTAFSRERGAIPAPYLTSTTDGFNAIYFDVATGAIFTDAEICVVVDADPQDGIVDGTRTPVSRLEGLHFVGKAFVLETIHIDGIYACLTVNSLSPFALVVSPPPATTSSTTSTTTTLGAPTTTTTTIPACTTALDCLGRVKASIDCPEGLDPKLGSFIDTKLGAASAKLTKAEAKPTKATKFGKQAKIVLTAIDHKAVVLAKRKKKPISAECSDSVTAAVKPVLQAIAAGQL